MSGITEKNLYAKDKKEIAEKLKKFYGLKLSDLPKLCYEDGSNVDSEEFAFLLTVHEKKITRSIVKETKARFEAQGYDDYMDYLYYKYGTDDPDEIKDIDVIVPEYEYPGLCEEAAELVEILDNETLQLALEKLAENNLGQDRRSAKMYLAYPICRYADENLIEELATKAKKWKNRSKTIEPTQKSSFADAVIYSNCKAAKKAAKTFKVLEKYEALHK